MTFKCLEAAIDPSNKLTFLLDWELTLKCNLDCSYCPTGIYGGHDNTLEHPPVEDCLRTLDFMYEYVDIYMSKRPKHSRHVILNVYGGESLFHPNIVELLVAAREKHSAYADRWSLTITTTTNGVVGENHLGRIVDLIDEFTVSYHTESLPKQKDQVRNTILAIKQRGRRLKCIILMHPAHFQDNLDMIEFCKQHDIKHLPRQLDRGKDQTQFDYKPEQVIWFDKLYAGKVKTNVIPILASATGNLTEEGRACCGGRQLVKDQNFRQRHFYVDNRFEGWMCSVNHFFLFVKQVNGEVFVNKDCKMNYNGEVGPIGHLSDTQSILDQAKQDIPAIQCKKPTCWCGLCAPKAKDLDTYTTIMSKYTL